MMGHSVRKVALLLHKVARHWLAAMPDTVRCRETLGGWLDPRRCQDVIYPCDVTAGLPVKSHAKIV